MPDPDAIAARLAADTWRADGGTTFDGAWHVRWRVPLLGRRDVGAYRVCLVVGSTYAEEARVPTPAEGERLEQLERALRNAIETDRLGILLAVSTSLGERVFVFHVHDAALAASRVATAAQPLGAVLEVESFDDPGLGYVRDEVLDGLVGSG